ncbi:MAG: hypothetical protein AMXMBFR20_26110 [Planctomycetia bacterium]|nr:NADH-quinone oxidoreductase subunit C [Planctomycetota bacterium]OQZ00457.1 MAG: hypothetical protein B6D36_15065 [Planctomycetes bacterium UTPLA1]
MSPEEIVTILKEALGERIVGAEFQTAHPRVEVKSEAWRDVATFLKDDKRLGFNFLRCISAVDMLEDDQFIAVYDLDALDGAPHSKNLWTRRHTMAVHVRVPRENPHIPSVADVWNAADWHEREAFDMMGIVFDGHPDSVEGPDGQHPRRILCPDDWEGFPLRKDYVFPMEYHGIPAVTEYGQTRPVH